MLRRARSFLTNALISALAAGCGLLLVELALQVIKPNMAAAYRPQQIYVSHFRPSTLLPFELVQNGHERFAMEEFDTTIITNSIGIRGPEIDFTRPRIVVMGDSLTFGYGVENDELYTTRLERLFGGKYQFVNAGFAAGLSPDMYAVWLRERGHTVKPTGVIVSIYENDYMDVALNRWVRNGAEMKPDDPGEPERIEIPGNIVTPDGNWMRDSRIARLPPWMRRLIKRSYLVGLIRDRLLTDAANPPDPAKAGEGPAADLNDQKFLRSLEMLWAATNGHLIAIYRVYGGGAYAQPGTPPPTRMDRLIAKFAAEHEVPVYSDHDDFDGATDFYPKNQHWTASGHRKVAEFLHTRLVGLGY